MRRDMKKFSIGGTDRLRLVGFFVETISGDELEMLLKDAIVEVRRVSYAQLKNLDTFSVAQEPTLSIKSGNFYRTVVRKGIFSRLPESEANAGDEIKRK